MSGVIYSFNIEVLGVYQEPQSYNETATGGVVTAGLSLRSYSNINASGGSLAASSGTASVIYPTITSGGIVAAGEAIVQKIATDIGSGSILVGGIGEKDAATQYSDIGSGGVKSSGYVDYGFDAGYGGSKAGGSAIVSIPYSETASGGAVLNGSYTNIFRSGQGGTLRIAGTATYSAYYPCYGGAVISGISENEVRIYGSGGGVIAGTSEVQMLNGSTGGTAAGGQCFVQQIFPNINASGGVTPQGDAPTFRIYSVTASDGVEIAGTSINGRYRENFGSGGARPAGSASVTHRMGFVSSRRTCTNTRSRINQRKLLLHRMRIRSRFPLLYRSIPRFQQTQMLQHFKLRCSTR